MSNTNIKRILSKGKLTGEEVGRIFLRDFARFLEATQKAEAPPKERFTEAEKQTMVNGLTDKWEIEQYNTYIGIIQFLQKAGIIYDQYYQVIRYFLYGLARDLDQAQHSTTVRLLLANGPLILTESQYNRLKKESLDKELSKNASVAEIILTATNHYLKAHIRGEQTPYNRLFEAYKSKPLTNKDFKQNYWQNGANGHYETPEGKKSNEMSQKDWFKEATKWNKKRAETGKDYLKWVDDGREAPPDATKYDILEFFDYFFNTGQTATAKDLKTFKTDYPDIYEAILAEIKKIKGLKLPTDYTKQSISYKTLYKLDLPYYREVFEFNPKGDDGSSIASFISVIPEEEIKNWGEWKRERYLDKDGNFKYELEHHERVSLTQLLPSAINKSKSYLKSFFAVQEVFKILGEQLGEDCISSLANDKNLIEPSKQAKKFGVGPTGTIQMLINIVNSELDTFNSELLTASPVIGQDTIKEIQEAVSALSPIRIDKLKPKKEAVAKVKELTKDLNYYGTKGLGLFDILVGDV